MGMSLQCYVGPYLRCENPKVDTVCKRRACGNKNCDRFAARRYDAVKFCQECGTQIDPALPVTEQWPGVENDELRQEIDERLCTFNWNTDYDDEEVNCDYWVPNVDAKMIAPDRDLWIDTQLEGVWPITDTPREMLAFNDVFAKEIERFKEAYGADAVSVQWGIMTAWW